METTYSTPTKKINPIVAFFSRERTPHDPWADAVRAAAKTAAPVAARVIPAAMPVAAPIRPAMAMPVAAPARPARVMPVPAFSMASLAASSYSMGAPAAPAAQWL